MEGGSEIILRNLDSVELLLDGKMDKIGGGILTRGLIDVLWEAGKQTGMSKPSPALHVSAN